MLRDFSSAVATSKVQNHSCSENSCKAVGHVGAKATMKNGVPGAEWISREETGIYCKESQ